MEIPKNKNTKYKLYKQSKKIVKTFKKKMLIARKNYYILYKILLTQKKKNSFNITALRRVSGLLTTRQKKKN